MAGEQLVVAGLESAAASMPAVSAGAATAAGSVSQLGGALAKTEAAAGKATSASNGFFSSLTSGNSLVLSIVSSLDKLLGKYLGLFTGVSQALTKQQEYTVSLYNTGILLGKNAGYVDSLKTSIDALSNSTHLSKIQLASFYEQLAGLPLSNAIQRLGSLAAEVDKVFPGRPEVAGQLAATMAAHPMVADIRDRAKSEGRTLTLKEQGAVMGLTGSYQTVQQLNAVLKGQTGKGAAEVDKLQEAITSALDNVELKKRLENVDVNVGNIYQHLIKFIGGGSTSGRMVQQEVVTAGVGIFAGLSILKLFSKGKEFLGMGGEKKEGVGGGFLNVRSAIPVYIVDGPSSIFGQVSKDIKEDGAKTRTFWGKLTSGGKLQTVGAILGTVAVAIEVAQLGWAAGSWIDKNWIAPQAKKNMDIWGENNAKYQSTEALKDIEAMREKERLRLGLSPEQFKEYRQKRLATIKSTTANNAASSVSGEEGTEGLAVALTANQLADDTARLQEAAISRTRSQIEQRRTLGIFEIDSKDLLIEQQDALAKIVVARKEAEKATRSEGGYEHDLAQTTLAEALARKQAVDQTILFNAETEKTISLSEQHSSRLTSALNAAQMMQVPFTLTLGLLKGISEEAKIQVDAEQKKLGSMKAYLATLSETDVLYKSTNANVEAQTTKVAGLQAAYISSIAYARRGWLEGFTASVLGGAKPGLTGAGISRMPSEGEIKGQAWEEGAPLTPMAGGQVNKTMMDLLGYRGDINKRRLNTRWSEDMELQFPGAAPGGNAFRTLTEMFGGKVLNVYLDGEVLATGKIKTAVADMINGAQ